MAPARRKKQTHLPKRVYFKHGAYYYVDLARKWIPLGKTLSEAMNNWVDIVQPDHNINTMNQLFDRYLAEVAIKKADASYKSNLQEAKVLKKVFGELPPNRVDTLKIYQFLDKRSKKAPSRANKEKALLSHVFTKAIRWGIVKENPCREVEGNRLSKRDRYITHDEFNKTKSIADEQMRLVMDFAYNTGLRQADILKLQLQDITDDGINIHISKTKGKILIQWTDKLREITKQLEQLAKNKYSEYLVSTNKGKKFTSSGFQSNWQKLIKEAAGFNYDIVFIKSNVDPRKNKAWLDICQSIYPSTPVMIMFDQGYFFWGESSQRKWRLLELDSPSYKLPEIKAQKRNTINTNENIIKLITGKSLPTKLYEQLEKFDAHNSDGRVINERFTFHDIRRKTATDLEEKKGREEARKLLGHSDQKMTGHYISGVQKVWPIE